jgi:hypothetical protein
MEEREGDKEYYELLRELHLRNRGKTKEQLEAERAAWAKQSKHWKRPPDVLIPASKIPHPDKDPEAFDAWAKEFVNHMRALGGLPPAYAEEGNEIPGRIKRR